MRFLYIPLFGALGSLARFLVSGGIGALCGRSLPWGTLAVNGVGSFLVGMLMEWSLRSAWIGADLRLGLTVGFLGGFTTFSTFSYETVRLLEEGNLFQAGANILLNVTVCLILTAAGIAAARQI